MDKETERKLAAAKARIEGIRSEARTVSQIPLYDNAELNTLRNQIKAFEDARHTQTQTLAYRHEVKDNIFAMVRELDRTAPKHLEKLDENYELIPSAQGMRLGEMIDAFDQWQAKARANPKGHTVKEWQSHAEMKLDIVARAIGARRDLIQPKHPQVDPRRPNALAGINADKYIQFARLFAEAAANDRKTDAGRWMFHHLPALDQVAWHTQTYLAMLDLAKAVQQIVLKCEHKPTRFWEINRSEFQRRLVIAVDSFNAEIPQEVRTKGDSKAYVRMVNAERIIREAKDVDSLRKVAGLLKTTALEHIMGSDLDDDHKLFTQIGQAYKRDQRLVAREEVAFEKTRQSDGETFHNALEHKCGFMNLVYEARWALAADKVRHNLLDYKLTLADPTISAANPASPVNYEGQIGPKGIVAREKAAREARKADRMRQAEMAEKDTSHVARATHKLRPTGDDKNRGNRR